jgi:hypothetical protein
MLPSIARPGESFHEFETKAKIRTEVHLDSLNIMTCLDKKGHNYDMH